MPAALNAVSTEMARSIAEATSSVAFDETVRCVVLSSSNERAFCVGADLKERSSMSDADLVRQRPTARAAYGGVLHLPMPAIAAVDGHALGGGFELALSCDVIIAGGTESAIHPITLSAFSSMQALSRRNDSPETASRPYNTDRDGFVMGEGAGSLVLETEEHALARGARIYAELAGGGVTADAYHITANDPEGRGASRAIELALEHAGASPDDVTHINAHATSTPVGDIAEYAALKVAFGDRLHDIPVSATKGATGHLLGGTGALEAIFTILAIYERTAPPTINLTDQDPDIPLDVVTSPRALGNGPQLAISNSFGFGGHNAVAAFRSV